MATVLSREGQQLSRQGYLEVGLANFLASWGDIENALERSADIITTSSEEHRTAVADILTRMEALGLKSHDNPVLVYSIAGYRKTLHEEDRIYGIMQLFGLKLGKSSNPGLSFSLSELEVQFAAAINKKYPVWAQLFVHGMNQSAGRHWCINQSCRLPQCVNIVSGIAKSQCHISVDANGQASFKGSCCSFEQLQAAWDSIRKGPFLRTIWTTETSSGRFPVGVILFDENVDFLSTIPKDLHRIEDELDIRHRELGAFWVREHGGDFRILYCGTIDNENVEYSSEEEWKDYKGTEEDNYASVGILAIPVSRSGITFWQRVGICFWTRLPELHASSISWTATTAILID